MFTFFKIYLKIDLYHIIILLRMSTTIIDLQVELQNYLENKNYRGFMRTISTNKELLSLLKNNDELYDTYITDFECLEFNVAFNEIDGCILSCNNLLNIISELVKQS